jgi:hypothetical protein
MKTLSKYDKQVKEIKDLTEQINKKSKAFAKRNKDNQYFDDLSHVLSELREINAFIN